MMNFDKENQTATADPEDRVREASHWIHPLRSEIGRYLIGQTDLVDRLLISLLHGNLRPSRGSFPRQTWAGIREFHPRG